MRVVLDGEVRELRTVWLEDGVVRLIDQRLLPFELRIHEARDPEEVAMAIEDMIVRGAPAIGATAAFGLAQAHLLGKDLKRVAERFRRTRPTGHDLFHAIDHILAAAAKGEDPVTAAIEYAEADIARCRAIGNHGATLIKSGARVLTHCNAGALATVDVGTVMAPLRVARQKGRRFFVYVSETRPRLQGARLTSWELVNEGIDHAIIADGASGHFLAKGEVDLVLVGADRIAANGDTANKIGTYEKAVVAKEHGVPFYVAAPTSTIDFDLPSGDRIPIEERSPQEVLHFDGRPTAPKESPARNPAFDVTPAKYITGIITEQGILTPRDIPRLRTRGGTRRSAPRPRATSPKGRRRTR
ncbi:MAG: S-methyl-5-thioribose-1-phosphate isomerase [Euryarchaeota archaeon RBG_16_68_13]|nr:MAG: S-methyl-5-thioribose-1-phosphate isomerase [Euryarchaeota archaeon RBG_16_68_13]